MTTLQQLKDFMVGYEITDVPDAVLTMLIADAERELQDIVGPFATTEQKTVLKPGGGSYIHLPYKKNVTVTSVTDMNDTILSSASYSFDQTTGTIRGVNRTFVNGPYSILVTRGFNNTIPDDIVQAAKYMSAIFALVYLSGQYGGGNASFDGIQQSFGTYGEFSETLQFFSGRIIYIIRRYVA